MYRIVILLSAIGLCIVWALAGLRLLPLAIVGWAVKTLQRGLRWIQGWGEA
jgi:hypothetical protein